MKIIKQFKSSKLLIVSIQLTYNNSIKRRKAFCPIGIGLVGILFAVHLVTYSAACSCVKFLKHIASCVWSWSRYKRVLRSCALQPDINILPDLDRTEIGDKVCSFVFNAQHKTWVFSHLSVTCFTAHTAEFWADLQNLPISTFPWNFAQFGPGRLICVPYFKVDTISCTKFQISFDISARLIEGCV